MIAVDTNIIAYLWLPNPRRDAVVELLRADRAWRAPLLWRSEFRNVLVGYLRRGALTLDDALAAYEGAVELMRPGELAPASRAVLACATTSNLSSYDCEFVAIARTLAIPLVTADREILATFPNEAFDVQTYLDR